MLTYTNINIIFIAFLILAICFDLAFDLTPLIYLCLYLFYSAIFFYGVFNIEANFFMRCVCSKAGANKEIAISFDDGPGDYTLEILQILNKQDIKAAFFCIGKHITGRENLFQQIHRQGHLIGNHSFSHHLLFDFFPAKVMSKDLQRMDALTAQLIGVRPKLFRPPFGVTIPWLTKVIKRGDYIPVGWSVRSLDTVIGDQSKLLDRAIHLLKPGAVYLFHDTNQITAAVLPAFIEQATGKGYRIVRLDEMLNIPDYQ